MSSIFNKLAVTINTKGHKILSWGFDSLAEVPENASVEIQWARAGGPWLTLYTSPHLICCYTDTRRTNKNKFNNDFYRIKLLTVDGKLYCSDAQQAGINISYPYSSLAKNLLRLADLEALQTGRKGKLLKKIIYGLRCPLCQQFNDDSPVNLHCPVCLGTGKKGGYYPAMDLNIILQSLQNMQSLLQIGNIHTVTLSAKCIAWPLILKGDVWVDSNNNLRFIIDATGVISKYKHVPLMCMMQMHRLLQTDILHSLTVLNLLLKSLVTVDIPLAVNSWSKVFLE